MLRLSLSLFVTSLFIQAISIAPLKANHYSRHSTDVSKFDAEAQHVPASEGHAQGPYVAAEARFKSSTFQTKDLESTSEPTCPTILSLRCFHYFIICLLSHCSVICLLCHCTIYSRFALFHYLFFAISSRFPLFHYLFVKSLLCSGLRLSLPLFCYVSVRSFQGFRCFICLLRRYAFSSRFSLFHCQFDTSVFYLFKFSIVS